MCGVSHWTDQRNRVSVRAMRSIAWIVLAGLTYASASGAEASDARRRTYRTDAGFLQVDPRTGAITECTRARGGAYRCERVRDSDPLLSEDTGPSNRGKTRAR